MNARRDLLAALVAGLLAFGTQANTFPSQPIKLIVPFAAGGPADVVARMLGQNTKLGQPLVVDNRAGAGGTIGAQAVAKSAPDGYTALFVTAGFAGAGALYPKLGYDQEKDFAPVLGVVRAPIVIAVNTKSKYRTLQELIADARANPDKLNCAGGAGGATITNLAFEALKAEAGIKINAIPYRGSAPAMTALLSGEIDCVSDNVTAVLPHIQAGTVRPLAVTTKARFASLQAVPTVAETVLPGFEAAAWFGVLVPRGTPPKAVEQLNADFNATLARPDIKDKLQQLGMEPLGGTPEQFGKFIDAETKRWSALIRTLGLKPE